jgi:hypothetical protein
MENKVITITVQTNMDSSQLLDLAIEYSERLKEEIESYGKEAEVDESQISVEEV